MNGPASTLRKLSDMLFPELSDDAAREIDKEAIRGIYYLSFATFLVEALSMVTFLAMHAYDSVEVRARTTSTLACCVLCLVGHFVSRRILKRWPRDHQHVMVYKVLYFVAFSAWGIYESAYHYVAGNQMLTFFAVEFLMGSFLVLRPWMSALLVGGSYTALYVVLVALDGAARVDAFNYFVFMFVSIAGMVVRFRVQRDVTQKSLRLEYMSTHDELTDLLNRDALDEDMPKFVGRDLIARMADINYFKEFNDTYGHLTGDIVLKEGAEHLRRMYPDAKIYRFGGDEFLIVSDQPDPTGYRGNTYELQCTTTTGEVVDVALSIGYVLGSPHDNDAFLDLVGQADQELYRVKEQTHRH